ncbi:hypothetical protein [Candidatus Regiella insecticola]|nr:hypothetical protein [Candidatus Regiella insecticola]
MRSIIRQQVFCFLPPYFESIYILLALSLEELKTLSAHFSSCYLTYRKNNRVAHQRKMGAGQKGFLPTPLDKLVFRASTLFYDVY